ncbi:lysine-sensitive aspartokinase 3 [Candidatus Providencia siddallii]|uniref:Aspartokinase n=1 Tax=Candidatus Providencia siddallii TaxID=1715285 RepID=A0ABM9NPY2_9GAMM
MNKKIFSLNNNQFIIAKIGGTSVANFEAMNNCANIIYNNKNIRIVIVSASAGITNLLIKLSEGCKKNKRIQLLQKITNIQYNIINKLKITNLINKKINLLLKNIINLSEQATLKTSNELTDEIVCYGELMSTLLFVEILKQRNISSQWFDIRNIMKTDENFGQAKPKITYLKQLAKQQLFPILKKSLIITQGFIGQDQKGRTTTLGRGGSDYTATLLAEALKLSYVYILTDVPGIFTSDPNIVPNAKRIDNINFNEAAEMATFGAKILHPLTLLPVIRANISIFIGSSKNPELGGTIIDSNTKNFPKIISLVIRRKQILLILKNIKNIKKHIFLIKIFTILSNHNIPIDFVTIIESNIIIIINTVTYINKNNLINTLLLRELSFLCNVKIEKNLSLITIIGKNLSKVNKIRKKIINSLKLFKIRMINYGIDYNNIYLIINENDADNILRILHNNLFEKIK